MDQMTRAVLFLNGADDEKKPLMLESILFCPLLTWAGEALIKRSIRRFFIVVSFSVPGHGVPDLLRGGHDA